MAKGRRRLNCFQALSQQTAPFCLQAGQISLLILLIISTDHLHLIPKGDDINNHKVVKINCKKMASRPLKNLYWSVCEHLRCT